MNDLKDHDGLSALVEYFSLGGTKKLSCHYVKHAQPCLTLGDPMDSVHGILQSP